MRIILITTMFLSASFIWAFGKDPKLTIPESTSPIEIYMGDMILKLQFEEPRLIPKAPDSKHWKHSDRISIDHKLAGISGVVTQDVFTAKGLKLEREVWVSNDAGIVAVRNRITNLSGRTIKVGQLIPLSINGEENFKLGESEPASWEVMVQKRLKNGRPHTFVPAPGVVERADPLLMIHRTGEIRPDLFVGFLSRDLHLAQLEIEFGGSSTAAFASLTAVSNFENTELPDRGQRTSQWVLLTTGSDAADMLFKYGDLVGTYHSIAPPSSVAPSVFCTWYYYSQYYDEALFNKDVVTFSEQDLPFDVFLIDECWSMNQWGDYTWNENFPSGMKYVAEKIRTLGMIPGIWTPPFLVDEVSNLASDHPEWILKDSKGEIIIFPMNGGEHWILDATYPGVTDYLERQFRKLSSDWGYDYFKFDFMRAIFLDLDQQFYDKTATSLEAYRKGLEAIRKGVGKDAYISVCGGHFGASMGLADSQRSGSDVLSIWDKNEIPKYRQNILRTWMSRLWHVDPDAMMVRRQVEPLPLPTHQKITLGLFSDGEAQTNALNQFIGGGLVTTSEDFATIDPDRKELYKHVVPSVNVPSVPVDIYNHNCPEIMSTPIIPACTGLDSWTMVSVVNWTDEEKDFEILLSRKALSSLEGQEFIVSEFFSQEVLGVYKREELLKISGLQPHHSKLLRIAPWNGQDPVLAGTDLHFSSGGVEITDWEQKGNTIEGRLETSWNYPVIITLAVPEKSEVKFRLIKTKVLPGKSRFWINL